MKRGKIILVLVVCALIASFFLFDLGQYFSLAYLKASQAEIEIYYSANPLSTIVYFFIFYVLVTGLSLPGASIMTLAAGAIFGLLAGTIIVSFASTIGATIAFLASRYLFRDLVQNRFQDKLRVINDGVEKDGAFYLFTLRLVPVFPFFVINLLMGLTPIRTATYAFVSQAGMLAATIVYVNAGTQLGKIEEAGDILSPALLASFVILGLFPLIAKKSIDYLRSDRNSSGDSMENESSV